uniref:Putative secreted protein n=1 Tax=Ixodes ricinus TaxID=34613 RepID=A0A6B0UAV5_IXORI
MQPAPLQVRPKTRCFAQRAHLWVTAVVLAPAQGKAGPHSDLAEAAARRALSKPAVAEDARFLTAASTFPWLWRK